jgi:hypothetical protein
MSESYEQVKSSHAHLGVYPSNVGFSLQRGAVPVKGSLSYVLFCQ